MGNTCATKITLLSSMIAIANAACGLVNYFSWPYEYDNTCEGNDADKSCFISAWAELADPMSQVENGLLGIHLSTMARFECAYEA